MLRSKRYQSAFSLVEILVSLLVVSLVAVNVSGLQKMVGDQNRDNSTHVSVVELATELMNEALDKKTFEQIESITLDDGDERRDYFDISWTISSSDLAPTLRKVELKIDWLSALGATQTFTYSEQISLSMLLKGAAGGVTNGWGYTIPNLLNTNKVDYFETNTDYQIDAYVIYNSQLFHSTALHSIGNGQRNAPPITYAQGIGDDSHLRIATVSDGWENFGRIDNRELAALFTD